MRIITVGKNDAGQRLDKFLTKAVKGLPLSMMYKSIRTKKIKVNRKRTEQKYILCEGDEIQLFIRDEFFENPEEDVGALGRITPKLNVLYEDENIMLLNKRPGVLVHEDDEGGEDPKFLEAVELAVQTQKVATSLLQRRLGVGYGRAAKIIDRMEELGLVSAPEGNKPRKLLPAAQGYLDHMAGGGDEGFDSDFNEDYDQ